MEAAAGRARGGACRIALLPPRGRGVRASKRPDMPEQQGGGRRSFVKEGSIELSRDFFLSMNSKFLYLGP